MISNYIYLSSVASCIRWPISLFHRRPYQGITNNILPAASWQHRKRPQDSNRCDDMGVIWTKFSTIEFYYLGSKLYCGWTEVVRFHTFNENLNFKFPKYDCRNDWDGAVWKRLSRRKRSYHYSDIIISEMVSQITGVSNIYSTVCSGADQRKHQISSLLTFWGEFTGDLKRFFDEDIIFWVASIARVSTNKVWTACIFWEN